MTGSNNEKELLIDAIQSLQELHRRSRIQDYALKTYASGSLSEASSSTPNTYNGNDEHRRKIRELTIALEAQAMDETRRFAMTSPLTRKEIRTPRVSHAPGIPSEMSGQPRSVRTYLNEAAAAVGRAPRDTPNLDESSKYIGEISLDGFKQIGVNEHVKKMESLGQELDVQLNATKEAQAYYKSNSLKDPEYIENEIKSAKSPTVAPVKTFSTELETTVDGSSKQRVSASTSSEGGKDGIIFLDTKQDFEEGDTPFEAPLSPNSFFVKYGTDSSQDPNQECGMNGDPAHFHLNPIPRKLERKDMKKAAIENNLSNPDTKEEEGRTDEQTNKKGGAFAMFKKIMVWDISSNPSHDASEEESFAQGRLYNDTFDDELSSKYTSSFESVRVDGAKRNPQRGDASFEQSYLTEKKASFAEGEGSISYQSSCSHDTGTSYTTGRSDSSSFDAESQSLYTSTDGSYDSLSPSSTKSSVFGTKGIPLM